MYTYDPGALTIYIDGSAYKNPGGPGGSAAIVEYPEQLNREREEILAKGYGATKNNRAELIACIDALLWARKNAPLNQCYRIVVVTDSLYLSDNWNQALNWERQRWKNAEGRQILNVDLWKKILSLRRSIRKRIDVEWLRGKSTEVSKLVDKLAKRADVATVLRKI